MTYRISIRSWFFLLHNRFPEANVLERYISFAVCLSLLKQNKRTGACKPFKSAVTNRFLKKQTWPFQFGSRSKKSRFLTRTAALCIWRARLGFSVVFGAQPRPFRRRHRKLFTRPFSSQLFALWTGLFSCRGNDELSFIFVSQSDRRKHKGVRFTQSCCCVQSQWNEIQMHIFLREIVNENHLSRLCHPENVVVLRKFFWALY